MRDTIRERGVFLLKPIVISLSLQETDLQVLHGHNAFCTSKIPLIYILLMH